MFEHIDGRFQSAEQERVYGHVDWVSSCATSNVEDIAAIVNPSIFDDLVQHGVGWCWPDFVVVFCHAGIVSRRGSVRVHIFHFNIDERE